MEPEYWTMGNKIKIVTGIYFSGDVVTLHTVDMGDKTQGILYSGMHRILLKWISPTGF